MSPLLPEVRDELVAAAARRRHARRRPLRSGLMPLLAGSCAITGATAIAAGTGMLDLGTGTTERGSRYSVVAKTSGANVCLAVTIKSPGGGEGRPLTCTPRPVSEPLAQSGILHIDNERLVTGIVAASVGDVRIDPDPGQVQLRDVENSSYRYFDVLVDDDAPLAIKVLDHTGEVLSVIQDPELPAPAPAPRN